MVLESYSLIEELATYPGPAAANLPDYVLVFSLER